MDELFDRTWTNIAVTRREAVAEVALARPEARNALNGALMEELTQAARLLRLRTDVLAVILTGTESYFSAGADLSASQARAAQPTLLEARRTVMAGPDLCKAWEEIEAVTIAAIEGYCIGGASALAVSCAIVRSSALGEDSASASFAGQLDSIADVTSEDGLARALRRCWASRWSARVLAYERHRQRPLAGMGVIVQEQIRASLSGVMFTANPAGTFGSVKRPAASVRA